MGRRNREEVVRLGGEYSEFVKSDTRWSALKTGPIPVSLKFSVRQGRSTSTQFRCALGNHANREGNDSHEGKRENCRSNSFLRDTGSARVSFDDYMDARVVKLLVISARCEMKSDRALSSLRSVLLELARWLNYSLTRCV